ncbi:hypothetical protein NIES4071_10980 [Calothrix sp. NIES-4071]|nr:hypothetical protein NIES4071_10980 [Calothrix sp. NIES-4071]BAZ55438.1 hypothetical protein NIES4105_10940 [Calothrix sp. NIES-4105]
MHKLKTERVYVISWNLTNYIGANFIMSKFKRRQFVLSSMTGAFVVLLNSITKNSFAQTPSRVTTPIKTSDLQKVLIPQIAETTRRIDIKEVERRSQQLNATADEIDAALDALENKLVRVKSNQSDSAVNQDDNAVAPTLEINAAASLTAQEQQAANNLVTAFQEKLRTGEVTASDLKQDEQTLEFSLQTKQACTNGRVCWKFKWWGVRIRLNHCAVVWATTGGSIAALAAPVPVKAAILFFVAILKAFDKGCGVQIHWLWFGVSWIKPKSCSKCN